MQPSTIESMQADDHALITIEKAAEKYGLAEFETKRLRGRIFTDSLYDPIGSVEHGLVRDDWRLKRFVANLRAANKSIGVR